MPNHSQPQPSTSQPQSHSLLQPRKPQPSKPQPGQHLRWTGWGLTLLSLLILIQHQFEYQLPSWRVGLLGADPPKADLVLVEKGARRLSLIRNGEVYHQWRISLGFDPIGHKQREGDGRTPEGRYILDWRNPGSCCFKSLHVSYPDAADRAAAAARGDDPGGLIMIHGQVNGSGWLGWLNQYRDHTHGCIALRNGPMEIVWRAVEDGTPIEIRP
ncbi:L,D-transpeptidase family protein [Lamprobacter modestohalophilus]|uniref:L,D-transpeptidase family protein n=1 Tax=Lamprobacter modestohalophilus TaxID=1064514 RepID=UPI002ADEF29B|nr:L,D-transpeptidase family protein [Lamprobacter modestohalophilus]MEA1052301.1 L,D-transpeptidase family protein [Lamprobacter modestohalophilus]